MNIYTIKKDFNDLDYEFVERKGIGHPDTLSDNLAEYLSTRYSKYTLERFGAVLHHNFDKVGLLGGASEVEFGNGRLVKPIRVLLNGRVSTKFGDEEIDTDSLLRKWVFEFLTAALPLKASSGHIKIVNNISTQSSPGKTEEEENRKGSARNYWFQPRGLHDLPELENLFSNDTSMGVGYFPFSRLEMLVVRIEELLNSKMYKASNPWIGSDIKVMGFRFKEDFKITLCIPQIANYVKGIDEYISNVNKARKDIEDIFKKKSIKNFELSINTRDNYDTKELYLTAIGSSIESGDEGLVGRGNRIQGFISPRRPMSMEGAAGKNPIYHIGKIYYLAAQRLSEEIYKKFKVSNEIAMLSQSGRELIDPWVITIHLENKNVSSEQLNNFITQFIKKIPSLSYEIIDHKIKIA